MSAEIVAFNPLDKKHLASSVGDALLAEPVRSLEEIAPFDGAGIYAIYYTGGFAPYEKLAQANRQGKFALPIYIGKASPAGARTGAALDWHAGSVLHKRLKEHAQSIIAAENLDIADFCCRFLVVDDIWIALGESLMIARFSPLWNVLLDGFGNHNPGKGRHAGMRSRWDTLHPGRAWAGQCAQRPESAAHIARDAQTYLQVLPASARKFS